MRFQFDGNQAFQLRAIESVADLLRGQPRNLVDFASAEAGTLFGPPRNRLDLDDAQLLENLQAVQRQNGITADTTLQTIEETINTCAWRSPLEVSEFLCGNGNWHG